MGKWYVYETLDGEYKITNESWDVVQKIPRKNVKGFDSAEKATNFCYAKGFEAVKTITKPNDTGRENGEDNLKVGSIAEEWSRCTGKWDALIYVDGSYRDNDLEENHPCFGQIGSKDGSFAYGMVVVNDDGVKSFAKSFEPDERYSPHHNVAGEIKGAMAAMDYAFENGFKKFIIRYDYNGIECWASGDPKTKKQWKANKPATIEYQNYYNEMSKKMTIRFAHVDGHTGNEGNEECDRLAKSVLFIEK